MFRKLGFIILSLTIMIVSVSDYADAKGEPPNPATERSSGPVIAGTIVIQSCDGTLADTFLTFIGKCKKGGCTPIAIRIPWIDPSIGGVPQSILELEDYRINETDMNDLLPDGDGDGLADCRDPEPGNAAIPVAGDIASFKAAAYVSEVTNFQSYETTGDATEDFVIADIELLYVVPQ